MARLVAKFGSLDLAIILVALVFATYFVLFLPMLPQTTAGMGRTAPLMMGVGMLIALAGLVLSVIAIASVVNQLAMDHPASSMHLFLGIVGVIVFGYSTLVLLLITSAFIMGVSNL